MVPGGPSQWKGPPKFSTFYSLNQMKKNHSTGTKGGIELKPVSKFEFVHCLNIYKKISIGTIKGPLQALFVQWSSRKSLVFIA